MSNRQQYQLAGSIFTAAVLLSVVITSQGILQLLAKVSLIVGLVIFTYFSVKAGD